MISFVLANTGSTRSGCENSRAIAAHCCLVILLGQSYLKCFPDRFKRVKVNLIWCKMPRASTLKGCNHWKSCHSFGLSHLNCHLDLVSIGTHWSKHRAVPNQCAMCVVCWIKTGRNIDIKSPNTSAVPRYSLWIPCLWFQKHAM